MSYKVLARKFRPQSFRDFVGQEHVTQTLMNAISHNSFPHALLLTGPRGTGKTTTARIVAKTLLCKSPQEGQPCLECPSCMAMQNGTHLDVVEIDGASNNGVDHIRELRDNLKYAPTSGAYKIYIVDEVHMLSSSAFNALLKTLEEPPAHIKFIFATTEVQKIPATILSRCQRFDLRNHSLENLKNHLEKICQNQDIQWEDQALWTIAKQAKGSMRDSLTLLDQLLCLGGKNLSLDSVMSLLGLTHRELLWSALKAMGLKDEKQLLQVVQDLRTTGHDPHIFMEEFLELLKDNLFFQMDAHKMSSLELQWMEGDLNHFKEVSKTLKPEDIHLLFDVSLHGLQRILHCPDPSVGLEMLLFKLLFLPRLSQQWTQTSSPRPQVAPMSQSPTPNSHQINGQTQTQNSDENLKIEKNLEPQRKQNKGKPPTQAVTKKNISHPSRGKGKNWQSFVHEVTKSNPILGSLLEHCFIHNENKECLTLGLLKNQTLFLRQLEEKKTQEQLQSFLKTLWSDNRRVKIQTFSEKKNLHSLSQGTHG